MKRALTRFSAWGLSALLILAPLGNARAAESTIQTRTAARDLAMQGAEAFEAKDYQVALDRFERAAALYPAPTISIMQARALTQLGRWIEALDKYTTISLTALPPDAPEPFRRARAEASSEADALRERVPRLEIHVDGSAQVTLDNNQLPAALLNVKQPVDPGIHVVRIQRQGREPFEQTLKLAAGEQVTVAPPGAAGDGTTSVSAEGTKAPASGPKHVWTYVAFGVGGAALTIGAVSGVMALQAKADAEDCRTPRCSGDSGSFNRTLALTGLTVGAIGVGIGTYLYFSSKDTPRQMAARVSPAGVDFAVTF
ncbi:MAG TPA: hypothetical protein VG937_12095 [Polyangiaceae bacterium]|jgi:hypothetical protein|nr:hypothetical protein [Polyangiaceae bacterium]